MLNQYLINNGFTVIVDRDNTKMYVLQNKFFRLEVTYWWHVDRTMVELCAKLPGELAHESFYNWIGQAGEINLIENILEEYFPDDRLPQ